MSGESWDNMKPIFSDGLLSHGFTSENLTLKMSSLANLTDLNICIMNMYYQFTFQVINIWPYVLQKDKAD